MDNIASPATSTIHLHPLHNPWRPQCPNIQQCTTLSGHSRAILCSTENITNKSIRARPQQLHNITAHLQGPQLLLPTDLNVQITIIKTHTQKAHWRKTAIGPHPLPTSMQGHDPRKNHESGHSTQLQPLPSHGYPQSTQSQAAKTQPIQAKHQTAHKRAEKATQHNHSHSSQVHPTSYHTAGRQHCTTRQPQRCHTKQPSSSEIRIWWRTNVTPTMPRTQASTGGTTGNPTLSTQHTGGPPHPRGGPATQPKP